MKLSEHQRRALAAIAAAGGRTGPEGGGYWLGQDGKRLTYAPLPGSTAAYFGKGEAVGTTTVKALARRGLLAQDPADSALPYWRRAYILTEAGNRLLTIGNGKT